MKVKTLTLALGVLLAFSLFAVAACGGDDETTTSAGVATTEGATTSEGVTTSEAAPGENGGGEEIDAAQLFAQTCATCHGPDGEGGTGPDLRSLGADQADDIEEQIRNGGGGMPAYEGQLSDQQIEALTEYVAGLE